MSQALTPAVGSKVGRYSLTAESPEALAASSFIGRSEDGQLARILLVARAGTDMDAVNRAAAQAKNVTHANTLRLLDVDSVDGRLALSFEHVEGVSLLTLVTAAGSGGLPQNVALRIVLDALEGLSATHTAGIAHGELGPHLVWVGADGQARVMGTGIAKMLGKALAPKTPSDRLAYVAPERVKAAASGSSPAADPKCDVFSAAVLLWELLSKQRLFAGRLESAVIQKVLTAPVPPLASSVEDIPDGVDEALVKAVDRDPARRTASARELADALGAAFSGGAATHEEVAKTVSELVKKTLDELRDKLTAAGATSASGELIVPPARPSFPTLDELWVQADDSPSAAPAVKMPPKVPVAPKTAPKTAPKPAPKPIAKPSDLTPPTKPIEVKIAAPKPPVPGARPAPPAPKPAEAKVEGAKVDEAKAADAAHADPAPAGTKPEAEAATVDVDVAIDASSNAPVDAPAVKDTAAVTAADADAPSVKDAEAAPASADAKDAPPSETKLSAQHPLGAKVETKGAPLAPKAPIAGVIAAKRAPLPRKGTLLGMAPPAIASAAKALTDASPKPPAAASDAKVESADASAPASKTPAQGSMKKSGDGESTSPPASVPIGSTASERTPASGGPASIGKRPALAGNLKPGDTLGRYELLLPVASGGMASVWAARLEGTAGFQKTVAIKTMLPGMSSDVDFEEMFLDEARVAARIRHPNVVEIFDLGEEGETLYLVMEWVDGETFGALQKGSKGHGGVPLPILLRLASQACAGMHAAHELRDDKGALVDLVHRDISPANILVSRTGFVKIVDFGVAKSKARMYTTRVGGMLKGKTPYLSPEQLAGQPIDRRSDLYSFGAVLYVMATGLHPFRGETEAKTIENIALRDPVPLRKLDPSIHPDFEAIVLKALAKDKANRFETASEMQRALDTLAASIGQTVNDDDVAAFIKTVAGDGLEKRSAALREAITLADAGKQPIQPRGASAPDTSKVEAADAEKVDIDDVEIGDEPAGDGAKAKAGEAEGPLPKPAGVPAIPPPPLSAGEDPLFTAPSLGSDTEPASVPVDTLAAASTEPAVDADAPPQRRRTPMLIVGGILGACALIGVIALAQSGGGKPPLSTSPTAVVAASNPDAVRTGAPAETPPPVTAAPAATEAPTAAATATEAPAAASATATPEPVASADPVPAKPEITTKPGVVSKPTGAVTKPGVPTKPVTTATKPVTTATKPVTKPIKKFEPQGI